MFVDSVQVQLHTHVAQCFDWLSRISLGEYILQIIFFARFSLFFDSAFLEMIVMVPDHLFRSFRDHGKLVLSGILVAFSYISLFSVEM